MKRTALTAILMTLFLFSSLSAQSTAANDEYIRAMTSKDPNQKVKLLKAWLETYGGSGHQYENFANATICLTAYTGKTPEETIQYGEKALSLGGLDDLQKSQVLLNVAAMFVHKGQNLAKAKNYAGQAVQTATAAKGKQAEAGNVKTWNALIGAGHFVQGQAMEKNKEYKGASTAYINSYNILKTKEIVSSLAKLGKTLYDAKAYADAEKAFMVAVPVLNDFGSTALYAKTLHKTGKKSQALKYYKSAYGKQKNGEIAYNIGILLANGSANAAQTNEAIDFLLQASFLSQTYSQQAMKLAEGLYFRQNPTYNEKVKALQAKSKNLEELTNMFNSKFGDKEEEELSGAEKQEMSSLLSSIEAEQKAIEALQAEQQAELQKFQKLVDQAKQKLGVK